MNDAMKSIGKAIKMLDEINPSARNLGTIKNVFRYTITRRNLINILFSNGYELQEFTYRVIKSKSKRELI
jgi:hypothetical protein